MVGNKTIQLIN